MSPLGKRATVPRSGKDNTEIDDARCQNEQRDIKREEASLGPFRYPSDTYLEAADNDEQCESAHKKDDPDLDRTLAGTGSVEVRFKRHAYNCLLRAGTFDG